MKKQTKKLTLNKKTISNLTAAEMGRHLGGGSQGYCTGSCNNNGCGGGNGSKECSKNANTCPGHNTCYTC